MKLVSCQRAREEASTLLYFLGRRCFVTKFHLTFNGLLVWWNVYCLMLGLHNSISDVQNIFFHVASLRCTTFQRNGYLTDIYHCLFFPQKVRLNEFLNVLNSWTNKKQRRASPSDHKMSRYFGKKRRLHKNHIAQTNEKFFFISCVTFHQPQYGGWSSITSRSLLIK